jgi:hypothetical protein
LLFAGALVALLGGEKCGGTMRSFVFKFDARPIYISENVLLVYGTSSTSCSVCDGRECFIFSAQHVFSQSDTGSRRLAKSDFRMQNAGRVQAHYGHFVNKHVTPPQLIHNSN